MTDPRPETHIDAGQWSPAATPARVTVVGSAFAGFHTCRALERALLADKAHVTVMSPPTTCCTAGCYRRSQRPGWSWC